MWDFSLAIRLRDRVWRLLKLGSGDGGIWRWRRKWATAGTGNATPKLNQVLAGFFNHLRAITAYVVFPSWQQLMATLAFDKPLARPP